MGKPILSEGKVQNGSHPLMRFICGQVIIVLLLFSVQVEWMCELRQVMNELILIIRNNICL